MSFTLSQQETGLSNMSMQEFINKSDYAWYKELFNKTEKEKLTSEEMDEIIQNSITSAEEVYAKFAADIELVGVEGLIKRYGTEVSYNDLNESNTVIAMYDKKDNLLIIFNHSIAELHSQIKKRGIEDIISKELLKNLILSHELYHIIEMNEEDIYTYSEFYTYKFLGFSRKKRLAVASEIGAFHFSKLLNEIDFSPCIISSLYVETEE